jgi:protein-S-isoprenylcysteine O-methyltransferase Ste14
MLKTGRREILNRSLCLAWGTEMARPAGVVIYVLLLVVVVFSVDYLFFKNLFWERLTVNVGIVLVFAAFYLRLLKRG